MSWPRLAALSLRNPARASSAGRNPEAAPRNDNKKVSARRENQTPTVTRTVPVAAQPSRHRQPKIQDSLPLTHRPGAIPGPTPGRQKKRLRSTKPLAHSKATALLQKMLKCSPGPCEAGVFASIVGGYSGVFCGIRGIRLAVGFLDGLAVPDRNANVTEFQYVFYCFLQRSLGPRRA